MMTGRCEHHGSLTRIATSLRLRIRVMLDGMEGLANSGSIILYDFYDIKYQQAQAHEINSWSLILYQ